MQLLIAGNADVDAGKTTFTRGLAAMIGGRAVKPRASNNRWYHQDTYRQSVGQGRLYGKDAQRLAADQLETVRPEDINPVHRLWQPSHTPDPGLIGPADREFLIDRVGDQFVVNGNATIPERVQTGLPIDTTRTVHSLQELNQLMQELHVPTLDVFEAGIADVDPLIVESYGDIALPTRTLTYDLVAVVEPGRVRYYPGDAFVRTAGRVSSSPHEGQIEPVIPDVIRSIEPIRDYQLPPLTSAERSEAATIGSQYRFAYEPIASEIDRLSIHSS